MRILVFILIAFAFYSFVKKGSDNLTDPEKKKTYKKSEIKLPEEISVFTGKFMYVPSGSYMSNTIFEINQTVRVNRNMSVQGFAFGEGEVTNLQYRTFCKDMLNRVGKDSVLKLLPDTILFISNKRLYLEGYREYYFSHPVFNNHPVTGLTWFQAKAYCDWLNVKVDEMKKEHPDWKKKYKIGWFRLPDKSEWEYAAKGNSNGIWSWGSELYRIEKGKLVWNGRFRNFSDEDGYIFKLIDEDDFDLIDPSISNKPNIYGLYNLSGNVNEWTFSTSHSSMYDFSHDLNPVYNPDLKDSIPNAMKKYQDHFFDIKYGEKIFRGGSFLYGPMHSDVNLVSRMKPDSTRCDIGFRLVMTLVD